MKHFRATHKETGEQIEFGLEDIAYSRNRDSLFILKHCLGNNYLDLAFKDYTLEYNHKGEFYEYE